MALLKHSRYLTWFVELGVAIKHDGRPVQYERNTEYFEWRYVSELANPHSLDDLRANVVDIREQIEIFRDRYDADDPSSVTVTEAAKRLDVDIEEAWDDLSTWAGLKDELRLTIGPDNNSAIVRESVRTDEWAHLIHTPPVGQVDRTVL